MLLRRQKKHCWGLKWEALPAQPAYSDIAPSDYYLDLAEGFDKLSGERFTKDTDV